MRNGLRGYSEPTSLKKPALVVIDPQRLFLDPDSPARITGSDRVVHNITTLVGAFRILEHPIVFTRHVEGDRRGTNPQFFPRALGPDEPLSEVLPDFKALMGKDQALIKDRHDAFSHGLPEVLRDVDVMFITGVQTHLCVLSTALGLARFSINPAVISDACGARTRRDHLAALRCLAGGHAWVVDTANAIRIVAGGGGILP